MRDPKSDTPSAAEQQLRDQAEADARRDREAADREQAKREGVAAPARPVED
ncbi:MAG TPA: hypothetical protein VGK41_00265 [Solirubrobacterales bacterium]